MRTLIPKYRIELTCVSFTNRRKETHSFAFTGKPSEQKAKQWRDKMNSSISKDGTNSHLLGTQSLYSNATIVNQKTGEIVAQYIAPMFEVI